MALAPKPVPSSGPFMLTDEAAGGAGCLPSNSASHDGVWNGHYRVKRESDSKQHRRALKRRKSTFLLPPPLGRRARLLESPRNAAVIERAGIGHFFQLDWLPWATSAARGCSPGAAPHSLQAKVPSSRPPQTPGDTRRRLSPAPLLQEPGHTKDQEGHEPGSSGPEET